jgi:hypothetical protein
MELDFGAPQRKTSRILDTSLNTPRHQIADTRSDPAAQEFEAAQRDTLCQFTVMNSPPFLGRCLWALVRRAREASIKDVSRGASYRGPEFVSKHGPCGVVRFS